MLDIVSLKACRLSFRASLVAFLDPPVYRMFVTDITFLYLDADGIIVILLF